MASASSFPSMFEGLDKQVDDGKVSSYGVSITTLDEVFLLVARGDSTEKKDFASSRRASGLIGDGDAAKSARSKMDLEKDGLFLRHVGALFRKRAAFFRRDKKAWVCTTVVPSLFVLVGFLLFKFVSSFGDLEPLVLDLNDYNINAEGGVRNPITYNSPESYYTCQPQNCDLSPAYTDEVTGEEYYFCGGAAYFGPDVSCSISDTESVFERISDAGAEAIGVDAVDPKSSSEILHNRSKGEYR